MDSIAIRLQRLMDAKGFTQYKLWKISGISQPTIGRILSGLSLEPEKKTVDAIAKALGSTSAYLYDGIEGHEQASSNTEPGPAIKGRVPLISWVQAGDWCEAIDTLSPGDAEDWLPCPRNFGPPCLCPAGSRRIHGAQVSGRRHHLCGSGRTG